MKFLIAPSPRFAGPNTIFPDLKEMLLYKQLTQNKAILGEGDDDVFYFLNQRCYPFT